MDITVIFKACVKTIKTRNRAFGELTSENDKNRILTNRKSKQEFTLKSREIVQQITRLRDFLAEHRKAYLNFSNLLSGLPQMTDYERDKIDSGAQRIINTVSNFINDLEREVFEKSQQPTQLFEHQRIVVKLMKEYLKQICKMYSEQRAIRVQRSVEVRKMSRIDSNSPKKAVLPPENESQPDNNRKENKYNSDMNTMLLEEESLSPEELQMFELENNQLYNELNSLTEEVRQIESKVVKIAELQEIFTEKVLQQDKDIDRIATTVVGTTENVKDANDQIRQAIQRNAGFRVWVLFFLLVMSFTLLFLDWYND